MNQGLKNENSFLLVEKFDSTTIQNNFENFTKKVKLVIATYVFTSWPNNF